MVVELDVQLPTLTVIVGLSKVSPVSAELLTLKVITLVTEPKSILTVVHGWVQPVSK